MPISQSLTEMQFDTKKFVAHIKKDISFHECSAAALERVVNCIQAICKHDYHHTGNNHNDDIEECSICGHLRYV